MTSTQCSSGLVPAWNLMPHKQELEAWFLSWARLSSPHREGSHSPATLLEPHVWHSGQFKPLNASNPASPASSATHEMMAAKAKQTWVPLQRNLVDPNPERYVACWKKGGAQSHESWAWSPTPSRVAGGTS